MTDAHPPRKTPLLVLAVAVALSGCGGDASIVARSAAQPDARPMRNVTSFSEPLACMDRLLTKANRRTVIISSSDIPDDTNEIAVGADDMLINAFSQMNRHNQAYVFLDQVRTRKDGMIDFMIADVRRNLEPRPQFYIRGSISQLDRDVDVRSAGFDAGRSVGAKVLGGGVSRSRRLSVVTVDLHLVQFSNRRVLPGASVANSMVVESNGRSGAAAGIVELNRFNLTLRVDQIESQSQAVRNLIELGLIELIGRHAGVPFETCLSVSSADPQAIRADERSFAKTPPERQFRAAQLALVVLGYLDAPIPDGQTAKFVQALARFQADERLIASGVIDLDTDKALRRRLAAVAAPNADTSEALASNPATAG